jgi:hypothetical protein
MTPIFPEFEERPVVAFGPEMPGWGSWEWLGLDLLGELARYYHTVRFRGLAVPDCDVVVVVKQALPAGLAERVARRAALVYCPVDYYGSAAAIQADAAMLRRCARVLVHAERLRGHFEPYARVEYLDHPVKFVAPPLAAYRPSGFLLWVGVRTNLPPLVEWVNAHPPPAELRVLTNPEDPAVVPRPAEFGFRTKVRIQIEPWSRELQLRRTAEARAALDIKGTDFRARHKPPAKAIDFLASGLPLAMNPDSGPVEHLARLGFAVASPLEPERWLGRAYWEETQRFGRALRELLSLKRIGWRYRRVLDEVLAERRALSSCGP